MTGETVAVLRRVAAGTDALGATVWRYVPERVTGCLVRPLDGSDTDARRPDGVRAEYDVAFPKAYTASAAPLRGCRVALVERGMDESVPAECLRVIGSPDVTRPCPTAWDLVARCGRAYG